MLLGLYKVVVIIFEVFESIIENIDWNYGWNVYIVISAMAWYQSTSRY